MATTSGVSSNTAATTSTSAATANAQKLKDQFLKILLVQLQNQNPMDPMKPEEFSSQLANFSSLEQQIDTNTKLDTLVATMSKTNISPISYLGTTVEYNSTTSPIQSGEAAWTYSTPGAASVDIVVKDATGAVVYSGKGETATGTHELVLSAGSTDVDGATLTMTVTAKDSSGNTITPVINARAKITAVDTSSSTPVLSASGYSIDTSIVKRIIAPVTTTSNNSNTDTSNNTDTNTDTSTNS